MWGLAVVVVLCGGVASAAPVAGSDGTPLPERGTVRAWGDLRAGHALVQQPATTVIDATRRFSPNAHGTATVVIGGRDGGLILGLHGAIERARSDAEASTAARIEPRIGGRGVTSFGLFVEAGLGWSTAWVGSSTPGVRSWPSPSAHAGLGWIGPGERVRPVLSLEARVGLVIESYALCATGGACASRRFDPAGTGLLGSAGVAFGGDRTR